MSWRLHKRFVLNFAFSFGIGLLLAGSISWAWRTDGCQTATDTEVAELRAAVLRNDEVPPLEQSPEATPDATSSSVAERDVIDPAMPAEPALVPPARSRPTSSEAATHFRIGFDYHLQERFDEALREFSRAIELDPTMPEPHAGVGMACESLSYSERAIRSYREAIRLDPAYQGARVALAKLLCDLGQNEESLALLKDVENTDQRDPLVWAEIAVNQIRLGNPREAIPLLRKYNAKKPRQAWGFVHLGRALADLKEYDAAETAYRRGLSIDANSELGNKWLAELLRDTNRRAEAELSLEKFSRLRQLWTKQRELRQALAGLSANPPQGDTRKQVVVLVQLADVRRQLGQHRKALVSLRRALDLLPSDPRLQQLYKEQSRRAEDSEEE